VEFHILGPLEVTNGGKPVPVAGSRERAVLVMLLLAANQVVSTDRLVEDLWGDHPPERPQRALQVFISRLRKILRDATGEEHLATEPPGYRLLVDPADVDATHFEALLAEGRARAEAGDHVAAAATLTEALALWRGPALAGFTDEPFAAAPAARLEEGRLAAIEERIDADLASGRHGPLAAELDTLTKAHPLRERLWGQRMLALYRCGRQAEALRAYQDLRRSLGEELGLEPTAALSRLEAAILRHDPELDLDVKPPGTYRHNLPATLTAFVGRRRELSELEGLLHTSRLLTLTGVGGAGKTRLAREVAYRAVEHYPDGTWMVELAPLREETQISTAVLNALGIATTGLAKPAEMDERVCAYLSSRSALLLLDNCEHLVDSVAQLVHTLLVRCPGVTVLATSREVLGLAGERTWTVPPLSLPPVDPSSAADLGASDAVALFCERAQATHSEFHLSDDTAGPVSRICHRLDGLPLALELAAARIRLLGAHELARRLEDRLRVLSTGPRGLAARHQTLRAMIDWSFDLLSADEQTVLRRLAVFPESFDMEAAEAVAGGEEAIDAFDILARLVDKSLITLAPARPDERRYRLLETIRQYAGEKLAEAGEEAATRRRHAAHFTALSAAWPLHPLSSQSLRGSGREQENLRVALEWTWGEGDYEAACQLALGVWLFWYWSGDRHGLAWVERIFALPEVPVTNPVYVLAFAHCALALESAGGWGHEEADRRMMDLFERARHTDDLSIIAGVNFSIGEYHLTTKRPEQARPMIEAAKAAYDQLGFPEMIGWSHHHLGFVAVVGREFEQARRHFEQAVEYGRGEQGEWLAPHALGALAPLTAYFGDAEAARRQAREAVETARALPVAPVLAMALARAAEAATISGDAAEVRRTLGELLGLLRALGMRRFAADALELAALAAEQAGDPRGAVVLLGAAAHLRDSMGEAEGGVRVVAPEITAAQQRLALWCGQAAFEDLATEGRALSLEAALTRALAYC
jgi:predicted ATPase/DNA-binding SARP family transcriptional activator